MSLFVDFGSVGSKNSTVSRFSNTVIKASRHLPTHSSAGTVLVLVPV
jgi:hypothetical protein